MSGSVKLENLLENVRQLREKIQYGASGQNCDSVRKAITDQEGIKNEIDKFIEKSGKAASQLNAEDAASYKDALDCLKFACAKKLKCLESLKSINCLENLCWTFSNSIDEKSVELTKKLKDCDGTDAGGRLPGFIGQMSQNCIFGVKDNWDSISNLARCLQIHLKNASEYHQFYHEIKESERWLNAELDDTISNFERLQLDKVDENTVTFFLSELEAIHQVLYQWKTKLDRLLKVAATLVPVDIRTESLSKPIPAISLSNYYSSQVNLRENEDILLVEGCVGEYWKVRNGRSDEGLVPSLAVLIPGPDQKAVESMDKLRFILLTYWTGVIKNYGKRLITLLLKIYMPQYTSDEVLIIQSLEPWEKENVLETLRHVETVLRKYWSSYDPYLTLEERLGVLRMILEGDADTDHQQHPEGENKKMTTLLNATPSFRQMATIYQDLSRNWELYKTTLDVYKYPELMLILDRWQQLQYLPSSQVSQFWKTTLQLETTSSESAEATDWSIDGEKVEDTVGLAVARMTGARNDSVDGDLEKILLQFTEAKEYEQVVKAIEIQPLETTEAGHEGGVTKISLDSRVQIKKPTSVVETAKKASALGEKPASDFGSITMQEKAESEQIFTAQQEERQTFTIKSVVNPVDKKDISLDEAIYRGVIVPSEGVYRNTVTGESLPIPIAMAQGSIKVAYSTKKVEKEKISSVGIITIKSLKEATRPFNVESVRDTSSGTDVPLKDAIEKGLVDIEKNFYLDVATQKKLTIHEAAAKQLVKIKYTGEAPPPEGVIKRYAVRAVVDRRNKKTVTFDEAVRLGLIDKETGAYTDNVTNEKLYVGDALVKGFIKARQVTAAEARDLNIDPTNQIVVDRTMLLKKKLLKPLAALGAFKKLGGAQK